MRLSIGTVFLGTGWGKLHNLGQVTGFFTELGIPFPAAQAAMVSGIELVGGTLNPPRSVHPVRRGAVDGHDGRGNPDGQAAIDGIRSLLAFEEFTYFAGFLWLLVTGAGKASLDALLLGPQEGRCPVRCSARACPPSSVRNGDSGSREGLARTPAPFFLGDPSIAACVAAIGR